MLTKKRDVIAEKACGESTRLPDAETCECSSRVLCATLATAFSTIINKTPNENGSESKSDSHVRQSPELIISSKNAIREWGYWEKKLL